VRERWPSNIDNFGVLKAATPLRSRLVGLIAQLGPKTMVVVEESRVRIRTFE
jgi:hypothetical protein